MPAFGIRSGVDNAEAYGLFVLTTDKLGLSYRQTNELRRPLAGINFNSFHFDITFGGLKSKTVKTQPDR